ncbi:MAG: MmgE/PrpD family protein [Phycisphaerales bacterium]|nr:MmgE/PrpD family protein [Phycisphaerales bacterium]
MPEKMHVVLPADTNQALGLAKFAIEFMSDDPETRGRPDAAVLERANQFHTDAVICGLSAIALGTNAPTLLRREAAQYATPGAGSGSLAGVPWAKGCVRTGVPVFASTQDVAVEKAIVANCAAVREWDSNGTNFGYSEERPHHRAGEFGHNDFYSVPVAAAQLRGKGGEFALRGMILLDEIRGRLAEVFSLKTYKIDHVVHGAIASAATFGAMMGATAEQIESAIGMVVAHYIPFRAIRAGKQLSDSKGASAAISTEAAILAVKRSMAGFLGPRDIFRNPEAIFRIFEGPGQFFQKVGATSANTQKKDSSPFDLVLSRAGSDFTVMGMHFKLGLYEHQSAGALQGLINLIGRAPSILDDQSGDCIKSMVVRAYEPAFGIIGDPAKRDPKTRQSADHSMLYLVCTMLRKALELRAVKKSANLGWKDLMLTPHDFDKRAIHDDLTRALMAKMTFEWGGEEYDSKYPEGIPTSMVITDDQGNVHDSGLVMYPGGHARNAMGPDKVDLKDILSHKFQTLGKLAADDPKPIIKQISNLEKKSAKDVGTLYDFAIRPVAFEE